MLWIAGVDPQRRLVCDRCGHCWDRSTLPWSDVDTIACQGCPQRFVCTSRPTLTVTAHSRVITLDDGRDIMIRPLVSGDRSELAREYEQLSAFSRRRRFFSPPKRLSDSMLDYLTDLDYHDRFALVAYPIDASIWRGIGVARWIRDHTEPSVADAAVTVVDEWQHRGVGTQLLIALVDEAVAQGITTFAADVLWENEPILAPLRALGARIRAEEPGVARVDLDLPRSGIEVIGTAVHRFLATVAAAPPADTSD